MHFLITAGGTREYIDPVRFISNASSGRMGYALARAAQKAGHRVILISASDLQPPVGVEFVGVDSAAEMFKAVKKFFAKCDCLIMAAAVADYTPVRSVKTKIKKEDKFLTIKLKPTTDILKWAGKHKKLRRQKTEDKRQRANSRGQSAGCLPAKAKGRRQRGQIVVGFALEDRKLRERAERKLKDKNLDMIIANTPAAVGADKSTVQIKTPDSSWTKIENASKITTAKRIIKMIERLSQ